MMKKTVITVILLVQFVLLCGFTPRLSEMFDEADLFTPEEERKLLSEAERTAEETQTEMVFLTYDYAGGRSTEKYTDDFCDAREFGYGGDENESFVMLAIDMDNREVYIKTGGSAIARVTDREIEYILDEIFAWMPEEGDSYYQAASAFLEAAQRALEEDIYSEASAAGDYGSAGEADAYQPSYNDSQTKKTATMEYLLPALAGSVLAGAGTVAVMLLMRKTGSRPNGIVYMGSQPRVIHRSDRYINTTVVKTRINTENHSGSSHGGGGSFHTSSGGHSYGGGGRKF